MDLKDLIVTTKLNNTGILGSRYANIMETNDKVYIESFHDDIDSKNPSSEITFASDYAILNGLGMAEKHYFHENNPKSLPTNKIVFRDVSNDKSIICYDALLNSNKKQAYASDTETANPHDTKIGFRPVIELDCQKIIELGLFDKNIDFKDVPGGIVPMIIFGEYPQTCFYKNYSDKLEDLYNANSPDLQLTGKEYLSKLVNVKDVNDNEHLIPTTVKEYTYSDKKMVRLISEPIRSNIKIPSQAYGNAVEPIRWKILKMGIPHTSNSKLSTGEYLNQTTRQVFWCSVEPIKWRILNWDRLPKELNPNGTGEDKTIKMRTNDVIMGGLAFAPNATINQQYYQNSLIRAYLNGYDIWQELESGNGNPNLKSDINYPYSSQNFLNEAFNINIKENKLQNNNHKESLIEAIKEKRSKRKKVIIDNYNLSIDEQIKYYIDNRRSLMLHGKSGIGKSRRVADIDPEYFLLTLRNGMMPEEILGKECPNPNGEGTKWYAPSWYNELCEKCKNEPDKNHILFIDELTNVNEYEQSLVYHIVLNHSLGVTSGKLPENCVVVAAGNSKDESNSAYNMSEPLFRRFHGHIYLPLDLDSLLEWGSEPRKDNNEQTNLHPVISRFLSTYPKFLYSEYDPDKEGKNYVVDPRAWEQVSDIIYDNDEHIQRDLLENKIGSNAAKLLIEFAKSDLLTKEDILEDTYLIDEIPTKLDEQYALALSLRTANEQEIEKIREFISEHLSGETLAKFDFVWVGKNPERAMIISELQRKQKIQKEDANLIDPNTQSLENNHNSNKLLHIKEFAGLTINWINNDRTDKKAIHCDTREKAKFLTQALKSMNLGHNSTLTQPFNPEIYWTALEKDLCYTNNGQVIRKSKCNSNDNPITVIEFNDIDFTGVLTEEIIEKIEDMIKNEIHERDIN